MCRISFNVDYDSTSELTAATATYRNMVTQATKTENILPYVKDTVTLSDISIPGNYELTVKLTNTQNVTTYSVSTPFRVGNCENKPPLAVITPLDAIQLPTNSSNLDGSNSTGAITTYKWTQKSGPYVNILTPNASKTSIIGMSEGTYVFTLLVTDAYGVTASTDASLTVRKMAVVTQPTLKQVGEVQMSGEKAIQIFEVGKDIAEGNKFKLTVYGVTRTVTAEQNYTATNIALWLRDAINKTTPSEWEAQKLAPVKGTPGYPPTATASGNRVTITLDRQHSFAADATVN